MNLFFKLLSLKSVVEDFDKNVSRRGWFWGNKKFIEDMEISVEVHLDSFPKKGAVLVYANHVTGLDPYLVSSVLGRDDVYFLSDVYQTKKGKAIAEHIIPVYYSSWLEAFERSVIGFFGFLFMRFMTGTMPKETAREKNREAINKAVSFLKSGHAVIIFPSGGESKGKYWKKGIGEIILQCGQKNIEILLYKCFFDKLSEWGLLRHFLTGKRYLKMNAVEISGERVSIYVLDNLQNSLEITDYLKRDFLKAYE